MSGLGPSLASGNAVLVMLNDMLILLSRVKLAGEGHFLGNMILAQFLENQSLQRLKFP